GRPASGYVEHGGGGERALGRGAKRRERRDLLDFDETPARNFRQHVGDVLLGHLRENRRPGGRGRDAVDRDVVFGELLAERFGQRDQRGLGGRIGGGIRIALLAGDRRDVDDPPVVLRDHVRYDRATAMERAVEVDRHHRGP